MSQVGRDIVIVLMGCWRAAAHEGRQDIGTESVVVELLASLPGGERSTLPKEITRTLNAVRSSTAGRPPRDDHAGAELGSARAAEVVATLREVAWRASAKAYRRAGGTPLAPPTSWGAGMAACLARALDEAERAGVTHANAAHLLCAAVADDSAAAGLLRVAGVDPVETQATVRSHPVTRVEAEPFTPIVALLELAGLVNAPGRLVRAIQALNRRTYDRRYGMLTCLQQEMTRLAVRTGAAAVTPEHAVLSILSLDHQLRLRRAALSSRSSPFNTGGEILRRLGLRYEAVLGSMQTSTDRPLWTPVPPEANPAVAAATEHAIALAQQYRHSEVGSLHLLAGLVESPAAARSIRTARAVDVDAVRAQVHEALAI